MNRKDIQELRVYLNSLKRLIDKYDDMKNRITFHEIEIKLNFRDARQGSERLIAEIEKTERIITDYLEKHPKRNDRKAHRYLEKVGGTIRD